MLYVYFFPKDFNEIRKKCQIDLSKISSEKLADECEQILKHYDSISIFLGYLEIGWMLDPRHEGRIRRIIRNNDVHLVSFFHQSLPFSWKNEIKLVYLKNPQNGES